MSEILAAGIEGSYRRHFQMLYRICYLYLHTAADAEDAVAAVFVRYLERGEIFSDAEREKAWLIVTAKNVCKSELRRHRRRDTALEDAADAEAPQTSDDTLSVLLGLSDKYKAVLYLFYYEDRTTAEIARLLGKKESTVRSLLTRGRELLRKQLTE